MTVPVIDGATQVIDYLSCSCSRPLSGPTATVQLEFRGNAGNIKQPLHDQWLSGRHCRSKVSRSWCNSENNMKASRRVRPLWSSRLVLPLLLLLSHDNHGVRPGNLSVQHHRKVAARRSSLSVGTTPNTKLTEAKNLVVFGNIAGTGTHWFPALPSPIS